MTLKFLPRSPRPDDNHVRSQAYLNKSHVLLISVATSSSLVLRLGTVVECSLCGYFSPTLPSHISHLRLVHSRDPLFSTVCPVYGCEENFRAFSVLNTHVYRHHRVTLGLEVDSSEPSPRPSTVPAGGSTEENGQVIDPFSDIDADSDTDINNLAQPCQESLPGPEFDQQKWSAEFLLKLSEGRRLSQVAVQDVIDGCRTLCAQTAKHVEGIVKQKLHDSGISLDEIEGLESVVECIPDPFENLGSTYLQEKFYRDHFPFLEPEEISLGKPYYTDRFSGRKWQKVLRSDKFYYVSLLKTLKLLLSNSEVLDEVLSPHQYEGDMLRNFCDGSVYKAHPLFISDPLALQIIGYYDELEVCNPLGAYVRTHKLGCLFFTLGNIRPQFRSSLKAIFVLAIAKHQDICEHGIDAFLSPFIADLNTLYLDGITVTISGEDRTFNGGLLAMLADNLAAHALGGFKENYSFALRICRTCFVTTEQAQQCISERTVHMRTEESHEEHCELLHGPLLSHFSTTYGVNRRSSLMDVPGFSVVSGLPHDIMHDLFEGVVPYELKLLLRHCVEQRYFSVNELNERILRFDFGDNKPAAIDSLILSKPNMIRQSASQMMALSRAFPLLIGDKVPEGDENWESFLLLQKICAITLSPTCTHDTVAYLRVLIEEKLEVFKTLYPDVT